MSMTINQLTNGVVEIYNGCEVKQTYFKKAKRWYVWLPKHSGLRELFEKKDRMLRSHYVWCRETGNKRVPIGFVLHHKDCNRLNDEFSNLKLMEAGEHDEFHRLNPKPMNEDANERHRLLADVYSDNAFLLGLRNGNNGLWDNKECHTEYTRRLMSEKAAGILNAMYRHDIPVEVVKERYEALGNMALVAREFGCSRNAIRMRLRPDRTITWRFMSDDELLRRLEDCDGVMNRLAITLNAPPTSVWRRIKKIKRDRGLV